MISRMGSGYGVPAVQRLRQVESGPAARSSSEARQAGNQAAAVVRIGAEARARAAASAAEARAAAATPPERPRFEEVAPTAAQLLPSFYSLQVQFNDPSSPRSTLEQFMDQLVRAQLEH